MVFESEIGFVADALCGSILCWNRENNKDGPNCVWNRFFFFFFLEDGSYVSQTIERQALDNPLIFRIYWTARNIKNEIQNG